MNNNDILIRLRYALDIKDSEMVEIFKLGNLKTTKEDLLKILRKSEESSHSDVNSHADIVDNDNYIECNDIMLESFLNGLIIFKRGREDNKPGQADRPQFLTKEGQSINNVLLKKLKIALSLTSEDMSEILESAGVSITKSELSALFRKKEHRNYRVCGDRYIRNFLKGLTIKYRG
ncbi:YehS family protein [Vallitalea okinawensis]|uniref:DUF1456 family protein n=1 Tax=Vallitalea okinawensis TaxID=2078660 RepID=UPI000CFD578A|nr:DUF1456 family protein [Vallitalea okinawensis]